MKTPPVFPLHPSFNPPLLTELSLKPGRNDRQRRTAKTSISLRRVPIPSNRYIKTFYFSFCLFSSSIDFSPNHILSPPGLLSFKNHSRFFPTDLQTQVTSRQRLESQQQENLSVQKEFKTLDQSSNIYKLIGPVLLKQERSDAEQAVEGRLKFIEKEM